MQYSLILYRIRYELCFSFCAATNMHCKLNEQRSNMLKIHKSSNKTQRNKINKTTTLEWLLLEGLVARGRRQSVVAIAFRR